jgi:hypothetical protein
VYEASSWAGEGFEEKIATLLVWANILNRSVTQFAEAQLFLENEDSIIGRVICSPMNVGTLTGVDAS